MKRANVLVLLVLEAWTVWARPSEAAASSLGVGAGGDIKLKTKDMMLQGCPCCRPATYPSPQEMAGQWCGLINSYENGTHPDPDCTRMTVVAVDSDHLRTVDEHFLTGRIHETKGKNYTKIENGSWLYSTEAHVLNFLFGLSADGQMLLMCGTMTPRGEEPKHGYGIAFARCLRTRDDWQKAEAGLRTKVQICEELPATTSTAA